MKQINFVDKNPVIKYQNSTGKASEVVSLQEHCTVCKYVFLLVKCLGRGTCMSYIPIAGGHVRKYPDPVVETLVASRK
jgi:hypothetical protein